MKVKNGFTLIEVLVSMAILIVGILAWVTTQNMSIKSRAISNTLSIADELMASQMDILGCQVSYWGSSHENESGTITSIIGSINYTLSWSAEKGMLVSDGRPLWLVTITVNWTFYGSHSVSGEKIVVGE
jgi:prepilin-type N-terminal cleavage/methylation domain-containing protein